MGLDDVFGDCQPQAGSSRFSRAGFIDPVKALKDPRQVLVGNAGAEVLHVKFDHCLLLASAYPYPASCLAVLHCVLYQVSEHLAKRVEVGHD